MTLRHRLLLVYGIVVLLSLTTICIALFELHRARQIFGALQYWNEIALSAEKLKSDFAEVTPEREADFASRLAAPSTNIALASEFGNFDQAREALNTARRRYAEWVRAEPSEREARAADVRRALDLYAGLVEIELRGLKAQAEQQEIFYYVLPASVVLLTVVHIGVIGWLLRLWLLRPLERLSRQVEALGRDEPPTEPIVTSPQEFAALARALDSARCSLGAMRRQLVESERLTTIGQLAAQLAHNLRNPLASIRAVAQITARHADEATRTRMDEIISSVDRLNQWIAGLMEVARRDPTPTRDLDLTPTLERVRQAVQPELAVKELTLDLIVPPEGLVCSHDPATLEHVLIAMIVNAIEASPLGSRIVIRGEKIAANGQGPRCRISVEDRGCGLPPDAPEKIFDFSYSTKQRGMGLGLGLARQALQRQGGSAHARNNPEGGATVYVELPIRSGEKA